MSEIVNPDLKPINSTRDGIKQLGGITVVARRLGRQPSDVGNWYERGFPPVLFFPINAMLKEKGLYAAPSLFGMPENLSV